MACPARTCPVSFDCNWFVTRIISSSSAAICASKGSTPLESVSKFSILVSYSFALVSKRRISAVILANWSSYGLVLFASVPLASSIILFCCSIAGLIRSNALSIRSCSLSICACMLASLPVPLVSSALIFSSALAIMPLSLPISVSICWTCATLSSLALVCSICSFD